MSRVAKAPIHVPNNVEVTFENHEMSVKGPKGSLTYKYNKLVNIVKDEQNIIKCQPASNHPDAMAQAGTVRSNLSNMLTGVTEGFKKSLDLVGVGYRVEASGQTLKLSLGFSHPVHYKLPEGIIAEVPSNTSIIIRGINIQLVGQVAAEIREFRPPEPYKGKGIRYTGEIIKLKDAKKK